MITYDFVLVGLWFQGCPVSAELTDVVSYGTYMACPEVQVHVSGQQDMGFLCGVAGKWYHHSPRECTSEFGRTHTHYT